MLTLKEWMELVDYKITEGSDYYIGDKTVYSLSSWNGDHNGWSFNIVFDPNENQLVYAVEVCDYKNDRAYRRKLQGYDEESSQAWDDVDWTDLETDDDFIQKGLAIKSGEDYDTRVTIPLDLPEQELMVLFKMAHEADMTFNDYLEKILREALADEKFVNNLKAKHDST